MYSRLPGLVIGFHGCDLSIFREVVCDGGTLNPSVNDCDWLGSGIYFWEQNYERALQWAKKQAARERIKAPAVVGAIIDLRYCLNLTDSHYIGLLKNEYKILKEYFELLEIEMPRNLGKMDDHLLRKLDCAVIEHLHDRMERRRREGRAEGVEPVDSARGLFSEGENLSWCWHPREDACADLR